MMAKHASRVAVAFFAMMACNAFAASITDEASAIAEARKYVKARCSDQSPCRFRPRREGARWNVWVEFTRRDSPGAKPHPYSGGHVILYFDADGRLVKRIEGE
jgi:hypothetical protein